MVSNFEQRLNDPEYKNWMKSGQALNILNESLQPISEQKMTTFHERLKKKNVSLNKCSTCKPKKEPADDCKNACKTWKADIFKVHSNPKMTYWSNVDPRRWPEDMWEVAKTFMPRGQKPGSYESDISSVLNLMNTCKIFQPDIEKKRIAKVLQVRNDVMHSKDFKVSDDELKKHFDTILEMFDNLVKLPNISHDVTTSQQLVTELEKFEFNVGAIKKISMVGGTVYECSSVDGMSNPTNRLQEIDVQELETELISQRFRALEQRLDSIEDQLSNQEKQDLRKEFEDFLNNNIDLKTTFNDELTEIFDRRLCTVEDEVSELRCKVNTLEKNPPKKIQGGSGQQMTYKNNLQEYCTRKHLCPVYEPRYYADGEIKGHGCVLTVDGKTFETDDPSRKAVEAEQKAAKKALQHFGLLGSSSETKNNDTDTTKHTTPHQLKKNDDSVGKEKPAASELSKIQEANSHSSSERTSILNGKSAAQFLKEHCDKNPNYKIGKYADKEAKGKGFSIILTMQIDGIEESFEGEVGESKKSAKQNAAWKAIQIHRIKSTNWPSGSGAVPSSAGAVSSSAGAVSSSTESVPSSAGAVSSSTESVPSSAGAVPSSAGAVPSSEGSVPSNAISNADVPPSAGAVPPTIGVVPSNAESVPSSAGAVPSSVDDMPCSAGSVTCSAGAVPSITGSVISSAEAVPSSAGNIGLPSITESVPSSAGAVSSSTGTVPSSAGAVPSSTETVPSSQGAMPISTDENDTLISNEIETIYKNKLQQVVQKQGEKKTPDYTKTAEVIHNGKKCFRGVVEFKYKYQIKSDGQCNGKKPAEQQAAKQALIQLNSDKKDDLNPKGKLLELFPREAVSFETDKESASYTSTLTLNLLLKIETKKLSEKKGNAHQLAAKEALDKINDGSVFDFKYFDFKK